MSEDIKDAIADASTNELKGMVGELATIVEETRKGGEPNAYPGLAVPMAPKKRVMFEKSLRQLLTEWAE